jgi:hypothetical protein
MKVRNKSRIATITIIIECHSESTSKISNSNAFWGHAVYMVLKVRSGSAVEGKAHKPQHVFPLGSTSPVLSNHLKFQEKIRFQFLISVQKLSIFLKDGLIVLKI